MIPSLSIAPSRNWMFWHSTELTYLSFGSHRAPRRYDQDIEVRLSDAAGAGRSNYQISS
ncbi:MAG: hypothetical protein ACLVJN_10930 [Streptococcus parasanguinis]